METKSYANAPRTSTTSRRLEGRIEELTSQLNHTNQAKNDTSRLQRSARDAKAQLADSDRARERLEEERALHEAEIQTLRQQMDAMVCSLLSSYAFEI
jgi:myosin protein heavy chain